MANYFDITADLGLLHPDVQASDRLVEVSAQVEAEVIGKYRTHVGNDYYPRPRDVVISSNNYVIMLRGYVADADNANSELKDALKRTIAKVISHRLMMEMTDSEQGVTSWTDGARSRTYSKAQDTQWPSRWRSLLVPFELRTGYAW